MDIEKALERTNRILTVDNDKIKTQIYVSDLKTILNELDKKEKEIKLLNDQKQYVIDEYGKTIEQKDEIINEMAEKIYYLQDEKLLAGYSKQEVIDYFTKKVENKND